MSEKVLCKKCGNEMNYFQEKGSCGWICPVCGDGVATTYFEPIAQDQTVYTVFLDKQDALINAVKVVAEVFSCNFLEARKLLLEGTINASGKAQEIQKKAILLKKGNVSFRIEPEFPYPIDEQQGEKINNE